MQRCSLFCAGWWPFLVFPLLLLLLFALFQWRSIEEDVASNTQQTINQSAQSWANAETFNRGRDVLISGAAPSVETQAAIKQEILSTNGVRTVVFVDGIAPPAPPRTPSLSARWIEDKIVLAGEVGSQTEVDTLVSEVRQIFGTDSVTNQLTFADDVTTLPSIPSLFSALKSIQSGASLSIENSKLSLNGVVDSETLKASIGSAISSSFPGEVDNRLSVIIPESIIDNSQCEGDLDELLNASKILFAVGKATIDTQSDDLIAQIAEIANDCPTAEFEVQGHTDSTGNPERNMILSQDRAQSVVTRLIELGSGDSRFSVKGYGSTQPIADNATGVGRAQNRRIEFNLKN